MPAEPGAAAPRDDDHSMLRAYLERHDAPCPVCRYNLRGVVETRCPECGAPLKLEVESENTSLGAWTIAIVSFALALGFDGVASILIVAVLIAEGLQPGAWIYEVMVLAVFLTLGFACGAGLVMLYARRRAWHRRTRREQRAMAAFIFAAVGIGHLAVGAVLIGAFS